MSRLFTRNISLISFSLFIKPRLTFQHAVFIASLLFDLVNFVPLFGSFGGAIVVGSVFEMFVGGSSFFPFELTSFQWLFPRVALPPEKSRIEMFSDCRYPSIGHQLKGNRRQYHVIQLGTGWVGLKWG